MVSPSDRELLDAAAMAAGIQFDESPFDGRSFDVLGNAVLDWHNGETWNPLTDDGDALRLAVKLGLHVGDRYAEVWRNGKEAVHVFEDGADPYAATRRAIVRAAAALAPDAAK